MVAQVFFSARMFVQWIMSERSHKVVSPTLFWVFSVGGSILFFFYGWLRDDFSIILGQFLSYYIYCWNLKKKEISRNIPRIVSIIVPLIPLIAVVATLRDAPHFMNTFLRNDKIPLWVVIWGSLGQIIFTMRFIYQWFYSKRKNESVLPLGFWVFSITGSSIIVAYGIYRLDPILILGQSFGLVAYIRNIMIGKRYKKMNTEQEQKI